MTINNTCKLPSLVAAHSRHFIHNSFSVVVNIIIYVYLAGTSNTVAILVSDWVSLLGLPQ